MDSSIYYTFSTIAQALASIAAVVGALCLFRLQWLEGELRNRVDKINHDTSIDTTSISEKMRVENHVVLRIVSVDSQGAAEIDPGSSSYQIKRLYWLVKVNGYIIRLLLITTALSFFTIFVSVWIMSLVELSPQQLIPRIFESKEDLLHFGIALFAFSLFFNGLTLVRVFRYR